VIVFGNVESIKISLMNSTAFVVVILDISFASIHLVRVCLVAGQLGQGRPLASSLVPPILRDNRG
jgi:hypothetical protein